MLSVAARPDQARPDQARPDQARPDEDHDLIERARQADQRAMVALYRRHLPVVKRTIAAIVGHDPDLDDLIQLTFVRAFRQLHGFRGDASLSTWLQRIAINVARTHLVSARRRRWLLRPLELLGASVADPRPDVAERVEHSERLAALYNVLAGLKPDNRVVFVLFSIEQHTIDEIAELLCLSRNTVAARLRRTRAAVTRSLQRMDLKVARELRCDSPAVGPGSEDKP